MARVSLKILAMAFGCSLATLRRLEKKGVDVGDAPAVMRELSRARPGRRIGRPPAGSLAELECACAVLKRALDDTSPKGSPVIAAFAAGMAGKAE